MNQAQLLRRIEDLEREVREVKQTIAGATLRNGRRSAEDFFGMFHNDPDFKRAMEAGAAYRRSLRPKSRRKGATRK